MNANIVENYLLLQEKFLLWRFFLNKKNMQQDYERLEAASKLVYGGIKGLAIALKKNSPQVLYAYKKDNIRIGRKLLDELYEIGFSRDYFTGASQEMFAENETGQKLKQRHGDAMNPQKQGVRFIPVSNPAPRTIPVMLSPVKAGIPAWASENIGTQVDIDKLYHERSYFVVASGDSMTGARIQEGDWLLVDESKLPKNGDIVIAEVEGAITVKRLKKNGKEWLLHPDTKNTSYQPIEITESVRVVGVVIQIVVQPS